MTTRQPCRRTALAGLLVLATAVLANCSPMVDHRGYLPREGDMQQLQNGMSKVEVEALLGSPSTTATINLSGDSYYYISSVVEQHAFLTVDDGQRAFAARGRGIAGVEGEHPRLIVELADVDDVRPGASLEQGEVVALGAECQLCLLVRQNPSP